MKIDVISGCPPFYKTGDDLANPDKYEEYTDFVNSCIRINPMYITMLIPNRWLDKSNQLKDFRNQLFSSEKLVELHIHSRIIYMFDDLDLGELCYFLYCNSDNCTMCKVVSHPDKTVTLRDLKKNRKFLESNIAEGIVQKAEALALGSSLGRLILSKDTYGLPYNSFSQANYYNLPFMGDAYFDECVTVIGREDDYSINEQYVSKNYPFKDKDGTLESYKVFIPNTLRKNEFFEAISGEPYTICTESFYAVGPFRSEIEALCYESYLNSKAVDFLIYNQVQSGNITIELLNSIPVPQMTRIYSDSDIYKYLGLSDEEIKYIEEFEE